jgi:hypothetical protein
MTRRVPIPRRWALPALALALCGFPAARARAQPSAPPLTQPDASATLLRDVNLWALCAASPGPAASGARAARIPLFRIPSLFPSDLPGLDPDGDSPPPDPGAPPPVPGPDDAEVGRLQVFMGQDNPYLDLRRPGDPGGVGFYRVQTQLQLFDTGTTGFALACRAVTPAGLESNGVNDGPTFISPALTVFQDLGAGLALHGFVGTDVHASSPALREGASLGFQYGVAVQQPVPGLTPDPSRGLFLFVEALGRYRDQIDAQQGALHSWEVLPGLHCRMRDSWWISGGMVVPLGTTRTTPGHWQVTCSWQF